MMLGDLHVLVVEDEALIAMDCESILEDIGCRVTISGTGRDAMAEIRSQSYDLAVVDLGLPDMDGSTLITWMRKAAPTMPIVVSTGYSASGNARRLLSLPPDVSIVVKPWDGTDLTAAVRKVTAVSTRLRTAQAGHSFPVERSGPPVPVIAAREAAE